MKTFVKFIGTSVLMLAFFSAASFAQMETQYADTSETQLDQQLEDVSAAIDEAVKKEGTEFKTEAQQALNEFDVAVMKYEKVKGHDKEGMYEKDKKTAHDYKTKSLSDLKEEKKEIADKLKNYDNKSETNMGEFSETDVKQELSEFSEKLKEFNDET